jgi:hypothetical protein
MGTLLLETSSRIWRPAFQSVSGAEDATTHWGDR